MRTDITNKFQAFAWGLTGLSVVLVMSVWLPAQNWTLRDLSTYRLFPLLGLLAFSLMWAHYVVAAVRKLLQLPTESSKQYFEITSLLVLAAILLHPGLFIWQLWRDGFGLPPGSYMAYVAPGLSWIVILGTVSLLVFLAYEMRHIYGQRYWWKYVQYASDAAMVAVFYHGLRLGTQLQTTWLRYVWYVYGLSYIAALYVIYRHKVTTQKDIIPST